MKYRKRNLPVRRGRRKRGTKRGSKRGRESR